VRFHLLIPEPASGKQGPPGRPMPGLYACGNDQHSILGGEYPGAGAQIGLAMTFGYLAATFAGCALTLSRSLG
jgi:hypothetical protein